MGFTSDEDSGRIRLDGDTVCYESKTYPSWQLAVADIRIIGEMTNQNGPFADDYFICFATDANGSWHEVSFYAERLGAMLKNLGHRLEADLELHLQASTDFASRVLWPPHLVGQPMFTFTDKVPHGIWERLKSCLLPENVQTLSETVLAELRATGSATRPPG